MGKLQKNKFKLDIKHPSYEVILPLSGTKVLVRGLTLKERTVITSNTINKSSSINIMMNVIFNAITNKEIFNNDYDFFIDSIGWIDLKALIIGVLIQSNRLAKSNLNLKAECPYCSKSFPIKMSYHEIATKVKINTSEPIFDKKQHMIIDDVIKLHLVLPTMHKELVIANITEMLMNSPELLTDFGYVQDNVKKLLYTLLSKCAAITAIESLESGDILQFNYDLDSETVLEDALEFVGYLMDFEMMDDIDDIINPDGYELSTVHEVTCTNPKCKKKNTIDLDDWLVDQLLPPIEGDL